ncbi:MAG: cytochrome b N-terminal domain-containing protein [Sandaracinaceae bacterium]|nr:cytochrome b N-terminal domain-containing protein [Sandaracinaceae bacterium]
MKLIEWLDSRTGVRKLMTRALEEEIQGGARWAYVFGSGLAVVFLTQLVTGLMLMATYTPSVHDAWSSVFYIQHRVTSGWFIRGMHHYGAQAMMVVMGMHLLQVTIYGAYKKPREVQWWLGLALMGATVGLAITGYLLPWDQKGYWATTVATNIAGSTPAIGAQVREVVVGGAQYGQSTLTRLYAAHVGALPGLIGILLLLHVLLYRRHGPTAPAGANLAIKQAYYPWQIVRDVSFAVFVLLVVALVTINVGAPLDAPADPSVQYPPRPEWYFLWLYQALNLVPGNLESLVTLGIPALVGGFLFALPFIDRKPTNRLRDRLGIITPVLLGACAIVGLTAMSLNADAHDAKFQAQRRDADSRAARAVQLARNGIPPEGPLLMLANDPLTGGRDTFSDKCTSCHVMNGHGRRRAPEHTGFASREWLLNFLRNPRGERFFAHTRIDGMRSQARLGEPALEAVTEFLFAEGREPQDPPVNAALVARGSHVFETKCMECHVYRGEGDYLAEGGPNLTGYASRTWIARQIATPAAASQYGELNTMPAFADQLSEAQIRTIAAYLRLQRFE